MTGNGIVRLYRRNLLDWSIVKSPLVLVVVFKNSFEGSINWFRMSFLTNLILELILTN